MRCIFCSTERPPSLEHVFPVAIGGHITTDRVCQQCNSMLGSRVDGALSDFFPMRNRRAKLGLAGNAGAVPGLFEILTGEAKLIGSTGSGRVLTTLNKATGKFDQKLLHQAANVVMPDGSKIRQISIDASDKDKIPTIIQRERKRHGMRPLSSEELAVAARNYTTNTIENPVIQKGLSVNFAYLEHAMAKIAYELAFLWLGESYLDDPVATELRKAICNEDVASIDGSFGWFGYECVAFNNIWSPHEAHHLAFSSILPVTNSVVVGVRVFDMLAAVVTVSKEIGRYFRSPADNIKLRFLALDSVSGKQIDTTFADETHRVVTVARSLGKFPPVPDPL